MKIKCKVVGGLGIGRGLSGEATKQSFACKTSEAIAVALDVDINVDEQVRGEP